VGQKAENNDDQEERDDEDRKDDLTLRKLELVPKHPFFSFGSENVVVYAGAE